ncbi:MAG: hypothetical protein ACTHJ8_03965 [Mucilaginibacter sp.]
MGTHGTIWHHRYCTHDAFRFKNHFWQFITRQLTINIIPEEIYVISHHVHHAKSDQPGDPYNAEAGFWYCFLADANHQPIAKDLSEQDYGRVKKLMAHTGVKATPKASINVGALMPIRYIPSLPGFLMGILVFGILFDWWPHTFMFIICG